MVLGADRRIVAANRSLLETLQTAGVDVLGRRPGDALGCVRADLGPGGCGTGPYCVACGIVQVVLESQEQQRQSTRECRVLVDRVDAQKSLDLRVTVTPLVIGSESVYVTAIEDIGHHKRLLAVQRTLFHELSNTAVCLGGYARYLLHEPKMDRQACQETCDLADKLIDEIQFHRDLVAAETGHLRILPRPIPVRAALEQLRVRALRDLAAVDKAIELREAWEGSIVTDRHLLLRVLGNMLKNALEATPPGGSVAMSCAEQGDNVAFAVHDDQVMPEQVQLQIFQRSFSTKGQIGRGLGTYSMKLFGERYLAGKVSFTSQSPEGTVFRLVLPKSRD
jgi:hypothetical protein